MRISTTNDVFIILKVDETEPIAVPTGQALLDSWLCMKQWVFHCLNSSTNLADLAMILRSPLEGPMLMQLWACVIKVVRKFVNEVTQRESWFSLNTRQ